MRYHLFQKYFGKMVKIKKTFFLSTWGITFIWHNCNLEILVLQMLLYFPFSLVLIPSKNYIPYQRAVSPISFSVF